MKSFATTKLLRAKQALPPASNDKICKFNIVICINCVGKMLIWGHFPSIMELLLNKYLGHFLIIEKTFHFLFIESAIKPTLLLHANVQIPWRTECNRSNWQRPECFYEPESPVTTPKSGEPKFPIHNMHRFNSNTLFFDKNWIKWAQSCCSYFFANFDWKLFLFCS